MINKKRLFVIVCIAFLVMAPMFATDMKLTSGTGTAATSMDLSWIKKVVTLIVGIFAGGYVLVKAGTDIFHAIKNSSEDPNGLKKAIGGLVLNIAVIASFFFIINYVFSGMIPKDGDTSANSDFFNVLTGALVNMQ